jgi:alpha-D-ribose 1-methylphosphonate 5-phosphate C-P lyase
MKNNANLQLKNDIKSLLTYFILDTFTYIISVLFVFLMTKLNIPSFNDEDLSINPNVQLIGTMFYMLNIH